MSKIRTALCHEISDDIHSLKLEAVDLADPGPGEVQIAITACSVNFSDILTIQGKYQNKPPLPFAPGGEIAGDIEKVGEGVQKFKPGDRVLAGTGFGGFAEGINILASRTRLIPSGLGYAKAGPISSTSCPMRSGAEGRRWAKCSLGYQDKELRVKLKFAFCLLRGVISGHGAG